MGEKTWHMNLPLQFCNEQRHALASGVYTFQSVQLSASTGKNGSLETLLVSLARYIFLGDRQDIQDGV